MKLHAGRDGFREGPLRKVAVALLLGRCECRSGRHIERFEADGLEGQLDKLLGRHLSVVPVGSKSNTLRP